MGFRASDGGPVRVQVQVRFTFGFEFRFMFTFALSLFLLQTPAPGPAPAPAPAPGPIIVETVRQPPITREITMGDVVLGAVGFVGLVMIAAAVAGLLVGVVVVLRKRARDKGAGPTDPGHARLRS
jgi:hypothetical protein